MTDGTPHVKVLVVDDDQLDREAVRRALTAHAAPVEVLQAGSCEEARSVVAASTPDCVLLDYRLPDGDGLALIQELRAAGARMPIVVLTGQTDDTVAAALMKAGATDYLPKGRADPLALAQVFRSAMRLAEAEARLERVEADRHRTMAFAAAITDSLAEGVLAIDLDGRITFANPAARSMLGHGEEDLTGRDARAAVVAAGPGGGTVPEGRGDALRRMRAGESRREDGWFLRADGSTFPVHYVVSPVVADGRVTGGVVAFHDISARRRAEAEIETSRRQLAQSEKMAALGTLVSGVAHEIRTPLTYVANNVYLVRHRIEVAAQTQPSLAPVAKDVAGFIASATEGIERVNSLVRDLRRFADNESGRREYAGLHEVVAGSVSLFRATQRGRIVVQDDLRPTPLVHADVQQLQRVVLNLLINAADVMPHGGAVRVSTAATDGHAEVRVTDEGPGLSPEVERRMWEPFFTTKPGGLGLGLSICRRIVESHEGTIRAENNAAGRGTTFVVSLPTVFSEVPVRGPAEMISLQAKK